MRALQVVELTGPDSMRVSQIEPPVLAEDQVLIDVAAAGVTFPDVLLTKGEYQLQPEPPFTPGCEVAGTVVTAPANSQFEPGDRVAAFCVLGGFAEQAVAMVDKVFPISADLDFAAAAALPMNYLTVQFALETRGRLTPGETVLVHGAAGGIGTAAIQFAKALGAKVIGVASTGPKAEVARAAGADEVVAADDFLAEVKDLTGGRGVEMVVDPVGGDRFTDSLRSLAPLGRLLVIGFTAGAIPTVKVNRLLLNNTSVVGVGWGVLAFTQVGFMQRQWEELLPLIDSGVLNPILGNNYPLEDGIAAVSELQNRTATGKILITP
jgi:NADPH2:quinone reductase